jgi:hypothetical protein
MKHILHSPLVGWPVRAVLLAALLLSLLAAVPVGAQDDFGHATITLLAPGAPAGAVASVQWQDRAGTWRTVEGWQGPLQTLQGGNTAMAQWAVYPEDYGDGPFRWVVSRPQGGAMWATSGNFFLPVGDGASLTLTVTPAAAGGPTDTQTTTNAQGTGTTGQGTGTGTGTETTGQGTTNTQGTAQTTGMMAQNFSTITIHAPGAPEGAWVGVQWRDQNGRWNNVEGWQAPLETATTAMTSGMGSQTGGTGSTGANAAAQNVPTKTFGVFERDYGSGPFRWIIYAPDGGRVFGTSNRFFLPSGGGSNVTMSVLPQINVARADLLSAELPSGLTTLQAETSTRGLTCGGHACSFSVISISVPNAPAGSFVGVQCQDSFGAWHDVPTWQGMLTTNNNNVAYQQWTIGPELQGQGPFRWVVYNQLGDTLLGATPGFMLPERNGINVNTTVPSAALNNAG